MNQKIGVEGLEKAEISLSVLDDGLGPVWMVWRRRRYLIALLVCLGFMNVYALRVNLSVAIVSMTTPYNVTLPNGTIVQTLDFDWDSYQIGVALSSFFYGYLLTQLPGGWLSVRLGGTRVFCFGIAATALLTVFTPPIAKGVTYPSVNHIWANWAPPLERTILVGIGYSGCMAGTIISMPICGAIISAYGWETMFYIFGVVGLIWCAAWAMIVKQSPRDDKFISKLELEFIESSIGYKSTEKIHHPWKAMLTSTAVWAAVFSQTIEAWGHYTLLTQLPSYMHDTLNFDIAKSGFFSGLPYFAMIIVMIFAGLLADFLIRKHIISITTTRKLWTAISYLCQAVFLLLSTYATTSVQVISCLVAAVGFGGLSWVTFPVNYLDIAPQHASVLMGFGNTLATLTGIFTPLLTGYIVQHHTAAEWKIVFYISASTYILGSIVFCIFGSGEIQPWAAPKEPTFVEGIDNAAMEETKRPEEIENCHL